LITYYMLGDGHEILTTEDVREWSGSLDTMNRMVARDFIGESEISTIFLGLDPLADAMGIRPRLFETMVIGGKLDRSQWRCCTWKEAEGQHQRIVSMVASLEKVN
jgi:hypothetical protein